MRNTTRRKLGEPWHSGIGQILGAIDGRDRELRRYDADPAFRREDQKRDRRAIHDGYGRTIETILNRFERDDKKVREEFARTRRSFPVAEIEAAWRQVETMLKAGLGFDEIVASPAFTRQIGASIAANARSFLVARDGGRNPQTVEREATRLDESILARELPLIEDRTERAAAEAEIDRRAADTAIGEIARFLSSGMDATARTLLGFALSDAGYDSGQTWGDILDVADPEWRGNAARANLSPDQRAALEANARTVQTRAIDSGFGG